MTLSVSECPCIQDAVNTPTPKLPTEQQVTYHNALLYVYNIVLHLVG